MGIASRDRVGRGRRLAILLVGLVGLVGSLFAVPAAQAKSEFFGISSLPDLDSQDLSGMASADVGTDRVPIFWSEVETTKGSRDWTQVDQLVGGLASHGIRPMPLLYGSPSWVGAANKPPIDTAAHKQAWGAFLKAVVGRYKASGSYWTNPSLYQAQFGPGATPLPIQSWQIWNEPALDKFFHPGGPASQLAKKYGQLLQVSNSPIRTTDPRAQIVLAGNPSAPRHGEPSASDFLNQLYNAVSGVKGYFDVAAVHPYASGVATVKSQIGKFRGVMKRNADSTTPLWITETGWGSGSPDQFGINKGLAGQAQYLTDTYKMLLSSRTAWNLQSVFWYLWRDPQPGSPEALGCSFCASAGLVAYNHGTKPSWNAFRDFSTDSTPPVAMITGGPAQGTTTHDKTPSLSFKSSEAGSTFKCHFDAKVFALCSSPSTAKPLTNGLHTFYVKAIDAAGNESAIKSRSFRVG